ncbi:MAG: hypothetical protein IT376_17145 [Polyangiaceae bacterium]|nr:hypothetical protein [Polyangiaceae bacterium]
MSAPRPAGTAWTPGRAALIGGALLAGAYVAFALVAVPRLTNYQLADAEFTGWTGPIARRIAAGERIYVDFVLPIPPGSFAILAAVQRLTGTARLLQELVLASVCHAAMAVAAYFTAAPFAGRRTALAVAGASLATITLIPKELAYDHTAQACAWGSIAAGVHAWLGATARARRTAWAVAGLLAALTLAFKQSTATGLLLGWAAVCSAWLAASIRSPGEPARRARALLPFVLGACVGLALLVGLLTVLGSTWSAFHQAVFGDGPALKGGTRALASNLLRYGFVHEASPSALVFAPLVGWLLARVARLRGTLALDLPPGALEERPLATLLGALAPALPFAVAAAWLAAAAEAPSGAIVFWFDRAKSIAGAGLFAALVLVVAGAPPRREADTAAPPTAAAFAVLVTLALATTFTHNLSFPLFRPFYDNNPIIPVTFLALALVLDRAALGRWIAPVALAASLGLFGTRFGRLAEARVRVEAGCDWDGLRVAPRATELLRAAERARELAGPAGTVLVVPDDVQLAALIGRPRPPLRGAIVFVDQYAPRLLDADLAALERAPPAVVIVNPRERDFWRLMYWIWLIDGPAERFAQHVLDRLLPQDYQLDSTWPTRFGRGPSHLEVWVRKTPSPPHRDAHQ